MQPMPLLAMWTAGGLETVIDMGGLLRPDAMFDPALRVRRQEVPDSRMRICIYLCVTVIKLAKFVRDVGRSSLVGRAKADGRLTGRRPLALSNGPARRTGA